MLASFLLSTNPIIATLKNSWVTAVSPYIHFSSSKWLNLFVISNSDKLLYFLNSKFIWVFEGFFINPLWTEYINIGISKIPTRAQDQNHAPIILPPNLIRERCFAKPLFGTRRWLFGNQNEYCNSVKNKTILRKSPNGYHLKYTFFRDFGVSILISLHRNKST